MNCTKFFLQHMCVGVLLVGTMAWSANEETTANEAVISSNEFDAPFDSVIQGIQSRIELENKQVVRQQNSNQYIQMQSVSLNLTDPEHPFKEYQLRVTTQAKPEERDAFIKVISAKMFQIDCESTNFEHRTIGNRYIYVDKSGKEILRFEDSVAICATL